MPIRFRPAAFLLSAGLALPAQVETDDRPGPPVPVPTQARLDLEWNGRVAPGLDLAVTFTGPRPHPDTGPGYPEVRWEMLFRCAVSGRPVAPPVRGRLVGTTRGEARVCFDEPGRVEILLFCRTPDGWLVWDAVPIQVD
jgi:hypothetical protein